VTFYQWLCHEPHDVLLRAYDKLRIPQSTNKLNKLLRYLDTHKSRHTLYVATRAHLKIAHRAYRAYLKSIEDSLVKIDIEAIQPLPVDDFFALSGLKPIGDFTITGRWVPDDYPSAFHNSHLQHGTLVEIAKFVCIEEVQTFTERELIDLHEKLERPLKPLSWGRVYQRWGFKHRNKCARCNNTIVPMVKVSLGQLWMCIDGAMCLLRQGICPDCRGPAKRVGRLCVTCDTCFTKGIACFYRDVAIAPPVINNEQD
jgi:hypothetical protein